MYVLREIALPGAAQGVMLSLAIQTIEHGNRRANRVLSAFIGVLSLRLLVIALEYQAADGARYPGFTYALLHLNYAIGRCSISTPDCSWSRSGACGRGSCCTSCRWSLPQCC